MLKRYTSTVVKKESEDVRSEEMEPGAPNMHLVKHEPSQTKEEWTPPVLLQVKSEATTKQYTDMDFASEELDIEVKAEEMGVNQNDVEDPLHGSNEQRLGNLLKPICIDDKRTIYQLQTRIEKLERDLEKSQRLAEKRLKKIHSLSYQSRRSSAKAKILYNKLLEYQDRLNAQQDTIPDLQAFNNEGTDGASVNHKVEQIPPVSLEVPQPTTSLPNPQREVKNKILVLTIDPIHIHKSERDDIVLQTNLEYIDAPVSTAPRKYTKLCPNIRSEKLDVIEYDKRDVYVTNPQEPPRDISVDSPLEMTKGVVTKWDSVEYEQKFSKGFQKRYNVDIVYLSPEQQIEEFESRKESASYKEGTYKCEICYRGYVRENVYKRHMAGHDSSTGEFQCWLCHINFKLFRYCRAHERRHRQRFKCKECGYTSNSANYAILHYKSHEGVTFACSLCDKVYDKYPSYSQHMRSTHASLACNICDEVFVGKHGLKLHMLMTHKQSMDQLCTNCEVYFRSSDALQVHREAAPTGHCKDISACHYCGVSLNDNEALVEHLQREHGVKLHCDECNMTLVSESEYVRHRRDHHPGRRVLKRARRSNGDQATRPVRTPFMCEVCGRCFKCRTLLEVHQLYHTGKRPFKCPQCPKAFTTRVYLKSHLQLHSGVRPFKCTLCPKTFFYIGNRDRHIRQVHHKKKPFLCHLCGKSYVQRWDVQNHIRTAHLKEPWKKRVRNKNRKKTQDPETPQVSSQ